MQNQNSFQLPEKKTVSGTINAVSVSTSGNSGLIIFFVGSTKLVLQGNLALHNEYQYMLKKGNVVVVNYEQSIANVTGYIDEDDTVQLHETSSNRVQDIFEADIQEIRKLLREEYAEYGLTGLELVNLVKEEAAAAMKKLEVIRANQDNMSIKVGAKSLADIDAEIEELNKELETATAFSKTILNNKLNKLLEQRAEITADDQPEPKAKDKQEPKAKSEAAPEAPKGGN